MTSGVRQVLPQVLTPGAGGEGKAARGRAPQGDFAEALGLGKVSRPLEADAKAAGRQPDMRAAAWPRLASALDRPAGTTEIAPESDARIVLPGFASENDDADVMARGDDGGIVHEQPLPNYTRNAGAVPLPTVAHQTAPVSGRHASATATHRADAEASDAAPTDHPDLGKAGARLPMAGIARAISVQNAKPLAGGRTSTEESPTGIGRDARPREEAVPAEKAILPRATELGAKPHGLPFTPLGRGEPAESIRFEPAARERTVDQPPDPAVDAPAEPARTAPRVTVLSQQNVPAPMPSTALVLAESIASGGLLAPSATRLPLEAIHASAMHGSVQSLKIQLHPAELGMVTATLRFAGEQLSIEIQVENQEAFRRLSSDSDAIVSALRDLGYNIDRVAVLQPPASATAAGRAESGASAPSASGRASDQSGAGTANGDGGGSDGRPAREGGDQPFRGQRHQASRADGQGGNLYI